MNIKYIGNSKDLEEPFGYCCDIRIYPGLLDEKSEIAKLGVYHKQIQLIHNVDFIKICDDYKVVSELKKIIYESQNHNTEQCALALKAVAFLCYFSTKMRLDSAKQNLFDTALSFIQSTNKDL